MAKSGYKKAGILVLAVVMMLTSALVVSLTNNVSVSNAFSGLSGGTSLSNTGVVFTDWAGIISVNPDQSVKKAALITHHVIFRYNPAPENLVSGIELILTDSEGNYVNINSVDTQSHLYEFTLPHYGAYELFSSAKDIYGYVYNYTIPITY